EIQPSWADRTDLVELLSVNVNDPDLALVRREIPLSWPRPTTGRVILQGHKSVLGPLRAYWHPETQQLTLTALSGTQPEELRVPLKDFFERPRIEPFNFTLHELDSTSDPRRGSVSLTRMSWLPMDKLREVGEVLDASTDGQVLAWAHRYLGYNRSRL